MRRIADILARRRREEPEPPQIEDRLAGMLREALPAGPPPAGRAQQIERRALQQAAARPAARRRSPLLLPAAAVLLLLLSGVMWRTPVVRAYEIAAGMRTAWQTVRDYQGEGEVTAPLLGKAGQFHLRLWYRRPGMARADFASPKLKATFLVQGSEARIRIPALACDVLVPLAGDFSFLRDLTQVGESFRRLEQMRELRLMGEEQVSGQECYVLRYRTESLLMRLRQRLGLDAKTRREVSRVAVWGKVWVAKSTLLPMKAESYDEDGALLLTARFSKVAVNEGVAAQVFAVPGKAKAERLEGVYTFRDLLQEALGAAGELW